MQSAVNQTKFFPLDLHSTERQYETNKIQYTVFLKCQYHISHKDMIKLVYKMYNTKYQTVCVCNIWKDTFKAPLESKNKSIHVSPQDTNQLLWENKKVNMHWETYNNISQGQTETTVWISTLDYIYWQSLLSFY